MADDFGGLSNSEIMLIVRARNEASSVFQQIQKDIEALGIKASGATVSLGGHETAMRKTAETGSLMNTIIAKAIGLFAAYISVETLIRIARAAAEHEKLIAQLNSMTGSTVASEAAHERLVSTANRVGVGADDMTQAYIRFGRIGLEPTMGQMEDFAALAKSSGIDMERLAYTINAVSMGSYRSARMALGMQITKIGTDELSISWKGTTEIIKNTEGALINYMTRQGELERMKGSVTRLSDAWATMGNVIGEAWRSCPSMRCSTHPCRSW